AVVFAFACDSFVVGVAGEGGDPVVGAGGFGRVFSIVDFAVGPHVASFPTRRSSDLFAVGVQLEGDRAFAGRFDKARDRGHVFDVGAHGHGRDRRGADRGFARVDQRALVGIAAFGRDFFVVLVARKGRDPVVGAGRRG